MLCMARRVNDRDVIHNRDDPETKIRILNPVSPFKSVGYQCSGTRRANCIGRHSFGYFSVAADRKVTRQRGEINA